MTDNVTPLRPRGKKTKVTLQDIVSKVVAANPRGVVVIGELDSKEVLYFQTEGMTNERALWLIEQIKLLLVTGEMEE